jgi:lipoate-protein ligase B
LQTQGSARHYHREKTIVLGDRKSPASDSRPSPTPVVDLGVAAYLPVQDLQKRLRRAVAEGALPGIVILLEHPPVITLGRRGTLADVRDPQEAALRGVDIVESERGGRVTLHAPGQLVSYPIVPIPRRDLRSYVFALEDVLATVLLAHGLSASRTPAGPGLYIDGAKVASLGLHCERGIASHGTSLNVDVELSLFDLVISCGNPGTRQTSMREALRRPVSMHRVKQNYLAALSAVFGLTMGPTRLLSIGQVEHVLGLHVGLPDDGDGLVPTAGFEPATPGSGGQCSIP